VPAVTLQYRLLLLLPPLLVILLPNKGGPCPLIFTPNSRLFVEVSSINEPKETNQCASAAWSWLPVCALSIVAIA
jgi:hypothetical protein